jgi:hypothetical protein
LLRVVLGQGSSGGVHLIQPVPLKYFLLSAFVGVVRLVAQLLLHTKSSEVGLLLESLKKARTHFSYLFGANLVESLSLTWRQ